MYADVDLLHVESFFQAVADVECFFCSCVDCIEFCFRAAQRNCCLRSASVVNCCAKDFYQKSCVDFLVVAHPAQSLSTKTWMFGTASAVGVLVVGLTYCL